LEHVHGVHLDESTRKLLQNNKIVVYDIEGPLFFGAAKSFITTLEKDFEVNIVILDMENVPFIDTSGAVALENIVDQLRRDKKRLLIVGMRSKVRKVLYELGVMQEIGIGNFLNTIDEAIQYALALAKGDAEHSHLAHFISEEFILLDVASRSRDELFQQMAVQASKAGIVKNKLEFLSSIIEREEAAPTMLGKGVAIPHARSGASAANVVIIFARLKEAIEYSPENPEKVKLVFMVSTGKNEREYLDVLRLIALNISNESVYNRLLAAPDVHEVHHILSELKFPPSKKKA
ncbi:MAG: PTS sugar transporter subunit IIA, partial [Ignavibacteriales bacterium]|nr:PTS sugar transporter subunit IIA [Ignavibacteriales bacterium]